MPPETKDDAPNLAPDLALGDELVAMDAHAREHHGVGLPALLARLIHAGTGIDLHPRMVESERDGKGKTSAVALQIGPGAPRG